jgi:argininosuccinate lyase
MLESIGVLSKQELETALTGLDEILALWKEVSHSHCTHQFQGKFEILPSQEDGHTAIEQYLTSKYDGDVGKKIHTGRSRNDQSLVMVRAEP